MKEQLWSIWNRFGQQGRLNGKKVPLFLQPLSDNRKAAPYTMTSLGSVDDRLWLCLSLVQTRPGDTVAWGAESFTIRTSEQIALGESLSYWRAVMAREKEAVL